MRTKKIISAGVFGFAILGITIGLHGQAPKKNPAVSGVPITKPSAKPDRAKNVPDPSAEADPFAKRGSVAVPGPFAVRPAGQPEPKPNSGMVGCLLEYIQLDHTEANRVIRKHAGKLNALDLREELERMIQDGKAEHLELQYLRTKSGQRAKIESIDEHIYPTEYDPPEIPQTMVLTGDAKRPMGVMAKETVIGLTTAANPTAFETRNVGLTMEVEPTIGHQDGKSVTVQIAPELIRYVGETKYMDENSPHDESKNISQPEFQTMRSSLSTTLWDGDYALISSQNPGTDPEKRVLVLIRVDILK